MKIWLLHKAENLILALSLKGAWILCVTTVGRVVRVPEVNALITFIIMLAVLSQYYRINHEIRDGYFNIFYKFSAQIKTVDVGSPELRAIDEEAFPDPIWVMNFSKLIPVSVIWYSSRI